MHAPTLKHTHSHTHLWCRAENLTLNDCTCTLGLVYKSALYTINEHTQCRVKDLTFIVRAYSLCLVYESALYALSNQSSIKPMMSSKNSHTYTWPSQLQSSYAVMRHLLFSVAIYLIHFQFVGIQDIHKTRRSVNLGQIGPPTMELSALESLKNTPIDL